MIHPNILQALLYNRNYKLLFLLLNFIEMFKCLSVKTNFKDKRLQWLKNTFRNFSFADSLTRAANACFGSIKYRLAYFGVVLFGGITLLKIILESDREFETHMGHVPKVIQFSHPLK